MTGIETDPNKLDRRQRQVAAEPEFKRVRNFEVLVSELRQGDGIDPRVEQRKNHRSKKGRGHSQERLASVLLDQLSSIIPGCLVSQLEQFNVTSVVPTRGNNFLVTVTPIDAEVQYDPGEILNHLRSLKGHFRSEVAGALNRKSVPDFKFEVSPFTIY